eukprot:TRINITY_DN2108_c0_g1::TRINITY_DN2108_c0_g1_i2::g.12813::m.12813 TRINITY_DN2108_c0_g1::TRINITY_DN2108_c0_g1_i2::g.12813  ORF type:complete len:265 (-),score=42.03,sp/Q8VZ95/VAP11_ARATH/44.53/4e-27,Motile_Sperm/PF00635.21/1.5e-27,DUF756/PF05506.7/0.32,DUF756/PF05506.7/1.4e+04 TRINITY_DN2108_c0_g1_i2:215-955(-)
MDGENSTRTPPASLLRIHPSDLHFQIQVGKNVSVNMQLTNTQDKAVAFKVKTTAPKKYCVKPNSGVVGPHTTVTVEVTLQGVKEKPTDLKCKDKFLVQSVLLTNPLTDAEDKKALKAAWDSVDPDNITEQKMRCIYVNPILKEVLEESGEVSPSPTPTRKAPENYSVPAFEERREEKPASSSLRPTSSISSQSALDKKPARKGGVPLLLVLLLIIVALYIGRASAFLKLPSGLEKIDPVNLCKALC